MSGGKSREKICYNQYVGDQIRYPTKIYFQGVTKMGYGRMKAFISHEKKPYMYSLDFECDCSVYKTLHPIERYFSYKSTGVKADKNKKDLSHAERFCLHSQEVYGNIPDCDGSDGMNPLILEIYKRLWNWEKEYYAFGNISMPDFKGEFGGDTINSMQTVFESVMKYALSEPDSAFGQYQKKSYSFLKCLQIYCTSPQKFILEMEQMSDFINFVNLYHTVGNMVLVPRYFNRGRYAKTYDFWDSSLVWLKNDGFSYKGQQIFDKHDFIKYINYFYLWDYVEFVNGTYKVKPLFDSHKNIENGSVNNALLWTNISDKQDLKQFLKNACENIERRGLFMTVLMRLKSTDNPTLKDICRQFFNIVQGDEFLNTVHQNGFRNVACMLLELLKPFANQNNAEYKQIYDEVMLLYTSKGSKPDN